MRGLFRLLFSTFVVLCVTGTSTAYAQKKLQWEQPAPAGATTFTSADAMAYIYKYWPQGVSTGTSIPGVTCTTTNAPLIKTCTVPLPNLPPGTTFAITAGDGTVDSPQSNSVTYTVPNTPSSTRIIGQQALAIVRAHPFIRLLRKLVFN